MDDDRTAADEGTTAPSHRVIQSLVLVGFASWAGGLALWEWSWPRAWPRASSAEGC